MKKMNGLIELIPLALLTCVTVACTAVEETDQECRPLAFDCVMESAATRGVYTGSIDGFRLFRYSSYGDEANCDIYDEECRRKGNLWVSRNPYRTNVNADNLYLGIGPSEIVSNGSGRGSEVNLVESETKLGKLTFECRVPEDADSQYDVIFGSTDAVSCPVEEYVPSLTFRHVLANVRVCGYTDEPSPAYTVKGVGFRNIYDKCRFSYSIGTGRLEMSSPGMRLQETYKILDDNLDDMSLDCGDGNEFFLVPQAVPRGAVLFIDFAVGGGRLERVSLDVSGDTWPSGVKTVYNLHLASFEKNDGSIGIEIVDFENHVDYEERF